MLNLSIVMLNLFQHLCFAANRVIPNLFRNPENL